MRRRVMRRQVSGCPGARGSASRPWQEPGTMGSSCRRLLGKSRCEARCLEMLGRCCRSQRQLVVMVRVMVRVMVVPRVY